MEKSVLHRTLHSFYGFLAIVLMAVIVLGADYLNKHGLLPPALQGPVAFWSLVIVGTLLTVGGVSYCLMSLWDSKWIGASTFVALMTLVGNQFYECITATGFLGWLVWVVGMSLLFGSWAVYTLHLFRRGKLFEEIFGAD